MNVLLVAPNFYQAIGIAARYIVSQCPEINFYLFSAGDLHSREKDFLTLLKSVDVVHWLANLWHTDLPSSISLDNLPCPSVASVHHVDSGEDAKIAYASQCDVIHVLAQEWFDYVLPRTSTPVMLAHYAVDVEAFSSNQRISRPHYPFRIGTFGFADTLTGRKRIDVLLESLRLIKTRGNPFELVIQGSYGGNIGRSALLTNIPCRNLGLAPSYRLSRSYAFIDVYVCSSDLEGGPLTVLESLASGVPVISTPVGVATEALAKGGGLLIEKGNSIQLAHALERLMLEKDVYDECKRATGFVIQRHGRGQIEQEYKELYRRAIQEWERKHQGYWPSIQGDAPNPKLQRKRELNYGLLRESKFIRTSGYKLQSVAMYFRALINTPIWAFDKGQIKWLISLAKTGKGLLGV